MKFFNCDWTLICKWLPIWDRLDPASRQQYLLASSNTQPVKEDGYGADLALAVGSGLVERASAGKVRTGPASVEFRRILRQLSQHPLFDTSNLHQTLQDYFRKHFYAEELYRRHIDGRWLSYDDGEWLDHFLNAGSARDRSRPWNVRLSLSGPGPTCRLKEQTRAALQQAEANLAQVKARLEQAESSAMERNETAEAKLKQAEARAGELEIQLDAKIRARSNSQSAAAQN